MFCGSLTNFRGCKFWMLNGKKGKCFGVIDFSGAVDAVASMGKKGCFSNGPWLFQKAIWRG